MNVEIHLQSEKIPGNDIGKIHMHLVGEANDLASLLVFAMESEPDLIVIMEAAIRFAKLSPTQKTEYVKQHPLKVS